MRIKHKLLSDYQYITDEKKIIQIKSGTFLEEYVYKEENIILDKEIVDSNPQFFQVVNWKEEFLIFLKKSKIPQPAVMSKKIIPFIDDMFFSSTDDTSTGILVDEEAARELENKEYDLNRRETRISDAEEDLQIRISRIQKREEDYKLDIKSLDDKEDKLRERIKLLNDKESELKSLAQELNEKERNIEGQILKSSEEVDSKYKELQEKIEKDLQDLTERENLVELKENQLNKREESLLDREEEVSDKERDYELKYDSLKDWAAELEKLNGEIQDWENLHWKFQRSTKPPSAL